MNFFNQDSMKKFNNNYGSFLQKEQQLNDKLTAASTGKLTGIDTVSDMDELNKLINDYNAGNISLENLIEGLDALGIEYQLDENNGKSTIDFEYNGKSYHITSSKNSSTVFDSSDVILDGNNKLHQFLDYSENFGVKEPFDSRNDKPNDKPNGSNNGDNLSDLGNLGHLNNPNISDKLDIINGQQWTEFKPSLPSVDDKNEDDTKEHTEETRDSNGNYVTTTYIGKTKVSEIIKNSLGKISEKTYYASGNIQKETNYSSGKISQEKEYYDDKNSTVKYECNYDYAGRLLTEIENDSSGKKVKDTTYDYYHKQKTENNYTNEVLSKTEGYDFDGNLLLTISYDEKGRTLNSVTDGVQTTIRHENDGTISYKETVGIDDDKTKETLYKARAYESSSEIGGYSYDKTGKISETIRRTDGTVESVSEYGNGYYITRRVEYYSDGLTPKLVTSFNYSRKETETEYNEKGLKTKETKYKYDGSVESEIEYDNGEKISETKTDYRNYKTKTTYHNGVKASITVYNASGKLVSKTTFNSDGSYVVEEYNNAGRVISKKTCNSNGDTEKEFEITYDSNGNRVETEYSVNGFSRTITCQYIYQKDTDILLEYTTYNNAGRVENRYTYTYNSNGTRATEKQYNYKDTLLAERTYDNQGREITYTNKQTGEVRKTTYKDDGSKTVSIYDRKGNLTAQEMYDKDGNLISHVDWSMNNGINNAVIKDVAGNVIGNYVENTDSGSSKTTTINNGKIEEEKIVDKVNNTITVKKFGTNADGTSVTDSTVTNTKTGEIQNIEEVLNEEGFKISESIRDSLGNIVTETKISYSSDGTGSGQVLDKDGNIYATITVTRDSQNRPVTTTTYNNPQDGVYKTVDSTVAVRLYNKYNSNDFVDGVETCNHYTTSDYRCVDSYNADGLISKRTIYDENGFVKTVQEYSYTYDNPNDKTTYMCWIKDSNGDWHKEYYVKGKKTTVYHYNKENDVVVTERYQNDKLVTGYNALKDSGSKNYYSGFINGNVNNGRISGISVRTGFNEKTGKNSPLAYFFMQIAGINCPESSYLYKDYQKQNSYEDLNSLYGGERGEYISSYIKKMLENQVSDNGYTPDMVKGYYFNQNSAVSKEIKANKDFSNYVSANRQAFENGTMRGKSFSFNAHGDSNSNDLYYTFHSVHIVDSWKDDNGKLHIVLADTYDFEVKDGGIAGAAGAAMDDGALRPFYSVMEIVM